MSSSIISPLDYCHVELIRSQKFVLYLGAFEKVPQFREFACLIHNLLYP